MMLNMSMTYPPHSPFAQISQGQERHERDILRSNEISRAIASARMSLVAALDCVHAIGAAMRSDGTTPLRGFAVGSLVRSAIESLGRAHYLISATDQDELLRRWVKLAISAFDNKIKESDLEMDRAARDRATLRRLNEAADHLGLPPKGQRRISFGRMAIDLMDVALAGRPVWFPRANGSTEYSFLSSIAHGEQSGHEIMSTVTSKGDASFGLNHTIVVMSADVWARCTLVLLPTLIHVVKEFLEGSAIDEASIDRWIEDTANAFVSSGPPPSHMASRPLLDGASGAAPE